jgi:hypothetical protein
MAIDLKLKGIDTFILGQNMSPDEAVTAYLAGSLGESGNF